MLVREVEIGFQQMQIEKEKVRSEIMKHLLAEKQKFQMLPDILAKRVRSTMDVALEKMQVETALGNHVLAQSMRGLKERNRELTIARARAQIEIEKLQKEMFEIKNSEQLNLIRFFKNHRPVIQDSHALATETRIMPPERLISDEEREEVFPMDMYEQSRFVRGEGKLFEDAFFQVEAGSLPALKEDYRAVEVAYGRLSGLLESEVAYISGAGSNHPIKEVDLSTDELQTDYNIAYTNI